MHEGHRKRKRELAMRVGFQNLEVHELLELVLYHSIPREDTNPTAHRLIDRFGSFTKVLDADYIELLEVDGIGDRSAFLLKLLAEVVTRYEVGKSQKRINVEKWPDLVQYVKSLFTSSMVEQFYCICLTAGKNVVSARLMGSGFVDKVDVPIKDILKEALSRNVTEVVIAHNHPFGEAEFSADDLRFTTKLREILAAADVTLRDHILVAGDSCISCNSVCT